MRALYLLALATTGCLLSEPEGTPQFWPPQLGGTVEAVVSGDFDANGSTDIVVLMSGNEQQAGAYLIDSDDDLFWDSDDKVRSFSRFVPMELERPVAAYFDDGAARRLYVATGSTVLTVFALSSTLEEDGYSSTTVIGATNAWIRPMTFPGGKQHLAISNGSQIEHLDDLLIPRTLPPPMGSQSWDLAQTVTSYSAAGQQYAVVATAQNAYRAPIPTMVTPFETFEWTPVRTGPPLLGQTAIDLDADGRDEILGYDAMSHAVCVVKVDLDPIPTPPDPPECIDLMTDHTGTDVTIIAGTNLSQEPLDDILVIQASGSETRYTLVKEVTYANGTLSSAFSMPFDVPFAGPARGRSILGTPAPGRPHSVLTFGTDGSVVCALGPSPC